MLSSPYNCPFGVGIPRKRGSNVKAPFSIIAVAAALTLALPAHATTACSERDKVVALLANKHSEAPVSRALAANGSVVEVFTTENGDSWTLTMTLPNGKTCLMATGQAWIPVDFVAPNKKPDPEL